MKKRWKVLAMNFFVYFWKLRCFFRAFRVKDWVTRWDARSLCAWRGNKNGIKNAASRWISICRTLRSPERAVFDSKRSRINYKILQMLIITLTLRLLQRRIVRWTIQFPQPPLLISTTALTITGKVLRLCVWPNICRSTLIILSRGKNFHANSSLNDRPFWVIWKICVNSELKLRLYFTSSLFSVYDYFDATCSRYTIVRFALALQ